MSRPRAVVCLSGGMDSTVCAALAARDYDCFGLHFSYGQRTQARELRASQEVAQAVGLRDLMVLETDLFRRIGGSALTDIRIAVPKAGMEGAGSGERGAGSSERTAEEIPVTYVPFRNAHFLSAAVSWAEVLGAATVFIGAVEQDSSGYPDCRPAYYEAFNDLIRRGAKESGIRVVTPLIQMRKHEIVRLGV
ncbi:MAG: 7-cyano-7-deazaguanine synthase, partial [Acidobacteriota bacterium]